ncbi:hypothetical protein [Denitrobaculum tricleocarpae]|uniref:Uncharacterized protein n=1 Tax=Denitrobaculum tricleocarpae TaxID=2591009 RepID=A0A545SXN4_9PROT|nr:hypothetical protein [Denitrobaculum tricleocarpae]TQV69727.1 hypothetical protein FKG95_28740 [Denitrobaculum tricleocarpae]
MSDQSGAPGQPGAPDRTGVESLLEPLDEVSDDHLPPRFSDALTELRAAIARCHTAGIPEDTTLAALLVETMPRLVEAYGADGAAAMLGELAQEISDADGAPQARKAETHDAKRKAAVHD